MLRSAAVLLTKLITGTRPVWQGCGPLAAGVPPAVGGETMTSAGAPNRRVRVYYANHGSHLDFATLWASLPAAERERTRPVAAADYWGRSRFTRAVACRLFNALLIPRTGITRESNPVSRMAEALEAGESLILFPEGTRSLDGEVGDFKPGLWHLARSVPHAELVPVYLQNLNRVLPKGHFLPIPLLGTVVFGTPVGMRPAETKPEFLLRARRALLDLVPGGGSPAVEAGGPPPAAPGVSGFPAPGHG